MKLLNNFPGVPRSIQVDALQEIEEAIRANKKFIILCAPTGSGKSHIAATLALSCKKPPKSFIDMIDDRTIYQRDEFKGYSNKESALACGKHRGIVLTVSKALQDQYKTIFGDNTEILKGKGNYPCALEPTFGCDLSYCTSDTKIAEECINIGRCEYYNAKDKALKNIFSVMNYSMALSLPDHLMQSEFLICDEASELEDELINHFTVSINYKQLDTIFKSPIQRLLSEDPKDGMKWLSNLAIRLRSSYDAFMADFNKAKGKNKKKLLKEIKNYRYIRNLWEKAVLLLANWYKAEIIIECTAENADFTPLCINNLSKSLFDRAKHVILLSATIIDPEHFAKQLGIDDYEYIELESSFDYKKSPIYCAAAKYSLSYENIDKNLPKVIDQVAKLCEHYKDSKGLIHTHNFKINEAIRNKFLGQSRFIYRQAGTNNEQLIKIHKERIDPTVLVSPSLAFGTDLPDDLGRFQVVVKLPYMPLGSKRVKTLFDRDKVWYQNKMLTGLVQACGRCTRHINDYADTFILDGQIVKVLKANWHKLPKYFKDRIH